MVKVLDGAEGGGVFLVAAGRLLGLRSGQLLDDCLVGWAVNLQLVASPPLPRTRLEDAFAFGDGTPVERTAGQRAY